MPEVNYEIPSILKPLYNEDHKYYVLKGGRGKGATWGIADYAILEAVREEHLWLCGREIQKSIKVSVHRVLGKKIK